MSARNPFEPPEAVVADVATARPTSRERMTKLAIAGAIAIGCLALRMPGYVKLVSANAMNPSIMFLALAGMLAFVIGLVRAFPTGLRGRRSFIAAIVLMALPLVQSGILTHAVVAWVFAPFVLAILLAAAGAVQVHGQVRASREPS